MRVEDSVERYEVNARQGFMLGPKEVLWLIAKLRKSEAESASFPVQLAAERDALKAEVEQLERERVAIQESERTLSCVFCGHVYEPDTLSSNHAALVAHVAVCEKHPASEFRKRAEKAELALADLIEAEIEEHARRAAAEITEAVRQLRVVLEDDRYERSKQTKENK